MSIFKMSIFEFLKIIFFGRTEKSGRIKDPNCRTENGKENINYNCAILINSENDPLFLDIFENLISTINL